jgi:hypothetical protein
VAVETEAVALWVELKLGRGEKCRREPKERNKGDARVLYGHREKEGEGEAEGGCRPAALP